MQLAEPPAPLKTIYQNCTGCDERLPVTREYFELNQRNGTLKRLCKACRAEGRRTAEAQYRRLISNANKENRTVSMSFECFKELRKANRCWFCNIFQHEDGTLPEASGGMDRKHNGSDYGPNDSIPCCEHHNLMKSDKLTHEEMLNILGDRRINYERTAGSDPVAGMEKRGAGRKDDENSILPFDQCFSVVNR